MGHKAIIINLLLTIASIAIRTAQTGANGIGVADEKAHTLDGANGQAVVYENHAQDSRDRKCRCRPTLHSQMGTGGGNVPFVLTPLLKGRHGGGGIPESDRDFCGKGLTRE